MPRSMAAPLLKKIPFVGGALASIAGGPSKLVGSALGKLGGLFGNDGGDSLKKIGNDIWDKTMGKFQVEITKSDSSESKKLNEEIKRIKKMINL